MRAWFIAMSIVASSAPAQAKPEPFGQETVEVRPWRNPPRPGAKAAHRHKHSHGHAHAHGRGGIDPHAGHSHGTGPHARKRGAEPHAHGAEPHAHAHGHGAHGHNHGLETEHLFGFAMGSDIDPPGAKHFIFNVDGNFTRQTGSYAAVSKHFEYAFTPWRDFHVGFGASFATHAISGVDGFDDRHSVAFEGFSVELRQRLLDRATAPFGLTLTAEPHWARIDEASGEPANKVAVEFTVAADKELIRDKLFGAINLIYEPEWVRLTATGQTERESTIGISGALMTRVAPSVLAGGELRYLRKYEGAALESFAGEALFLGPILAVNVNESLMLVAAYSTQVAGRMAGGPWSLDLDNFERHRARLKAVVNF